MNGAQLHLAINHFPVVLTILCAILLLWGLLKKSSEVKKIALVIAVATSLFSGMAYLTGEPAEDVIKDRPSFSEERIEEHEDAALFALIASIAAGVLALGALAMGQKKPSLSAQIYIAVLILTLFGSSIFIRTAHLGGLIQHEEIRQN